eukprot:2311179-Prymnesium_polylepis.1
MLRPAWVAWVWARVIPCDCTGALPAGDHTVESSRVAATPKKDEISEFSTQTEAVAKLAWFKVGVLGEAWPIWLSAHKILVRRLVPGGACAEE